MGTEGGSDLIDDSQHTESYGTSLRDVVLCGGQGAGGTQREPVQNHLNIVL